VWLLAEIKAVMLQFEGQRSLFVSLTEAGQNFLNFRQGPEMSLVTYKTEVENLIDVYKHYGGNISYCSALVSLVDPKITDTTLRVQTARNRCIGINFLHRADKRRYGTLVADFENQFARNNDQILPKHTECW
jgi:hypothetical protein